MDFLSLSCNRGIFQVREFHCCPLPIASVHSNIIIITVFVTAIPTHWYVFLSFSILVWKQTDVRGPCWG